MIDDLKLPADTPLKEKPKLLPADIYLEWVIENVRHLHETGRLECVPIRHAVRPKYRSSFSAPRPQRFTIECAHCAEWH